MRKIFTANNPTEAELVRGILESAGIAAEVKGTDLWGARGEVPVGPDTDPTVWVEDDSRAEEAQALLADFNRDRPTVQGAAWTCPQCGEISEPQFTECWKCGTGRPG
jgi:hypothetical protein